MLGIGYVKVQPTTHLIAYRNGKVVREGPGLSFFYFKPTTSLVAVPVGSRDSPFIFEVQTADFQGVTVQGQVTYRIARPRDAVAMLNYTLRPDAKTYESDDPQNLPERVTAIAKVVVQSEIGALRLRDALRGATTVSAAVAQRFSRHPAIVALGLELLGFSILAIKPTTETGRALEAEAREAILKSADDAIFERRNSSVDGERRIRENELNTEIAVEQKKRQIRETQMEAEASLRAKKHELDRADMDASIGLEEERKAFVERKAANIRTLAEADAHRVEAVVDALKNADPRIVQALTASGMDSGQLIAQAFGGIAERADKIGEFNMSPDLLNSLLAGRRKEKETDRAGR
jgi:regulator of protease activity HflC (stomatin/prohibitin superfamily)